MRHCEAVCLFPYTGSKISEENNHINDEVITIMKHFEFDSYTTYTVILCYIADKCIKLYSYILAHINNWYHFYTFFNYYFIES